MGVCEGGFMIIAKIEVTRRERDLARATKEKISELFSAGFWFCRDCNRVCERVEGEHGQPSHCARCKSYRVEFSGIE
jgi:rubrerythrin